MAPDHALRMLPHNACRWHRPHTMPLSLYHEDLIYHWRLIGREWYCRTAVFLLLSLGVQRRHPAVSAGHRDARGRTLVGVDGGIPGLDIRVHFHLAGRVQLLLHVCDRHCEGVQVQVQGDRQSSGQRQGQVVRTGDGAGGGSSGKGR